MIATEDECVCTQCDNDEEKVKGQVHVHFVRIHRFGYHLVGVEGRQDSTGEQTGQPNDPQTTFSSSRRHIDTIFHVQRDGKKPGSNE